MIDTVYHLVAALGFCQAAGRSIIARSLRAGRTRLTLRVGPGLVSASRATRRRLPDQEFLKGEAAARVDHRLLKGQAPPICGACPSFLTPELFAN
ncbi:hypothetical protein JQ633_23425 [Bradyrhizobium tropiciagri]|uniref:hypothetical protein n=1 Tax=Bradyrhizobium tropiciagri TaxID=312253 RepID=UPI001BA5FBB1|nr:hypothetical protein [Bradyrhizobium tropiciagri]MBR0873326.1 hypothetical protein [Bradyrhizobium tropiciagri]